VADHIIIIVVVITITIIIITISSPSSSFPYHRHHHHHHSSGVQNWNGCKTGTNGNNLKFKPLHIFDCCESKKIN
jgi:hypothetical protein